MKERESEVETRLSPSEAWETETRLSTPSVSRSSSFNTVKRPRVQKRDTTIKRSSSFKFLSRRSQSKQTRLTLDVLQSLTPYKNGVDMVTEAARDLLINCLQTEEVVHDIFFPHVTKDTRLTVDDLRGFPIDSLAVALVAEAISECRDKFKFYCTIEKNYLDDELRDIYTSVHWKKLGFSLYTKLYPEVVKDGRANVCLQDFINDDGQLWAERILVNITDPKWTMKWVQKIVRGQCSEEDYNNEMNALFVKLHLLDPQSVIPAFHFLVNQRALPAVNLELATRNYLGGKLDCTQIIRYVEAAILKESLPVNVSRLSLNQIELFYGVEVDEFIVTECRNLGVWNGNRPDNQKLSKVSDRCCVM